MFGHIRESKIASCHARMWSPAASSLTMLEVSHVNGPSIPEQAEVHATALNSRVKKL